MVTLLEIRIGNEYLLLRSINTEELAVEAVKCMITDLYPGTDLTNKFRLYMGPDNGYKYYSVTAGKFEF